MTSAIVCTSIETLKMLYDSQINDIVFLIMKSLELTNKKDKELVVGILNALKHLLELD